MRTKEIKILLDSFYAGEISQHGELLLKEYFNSNEVADELLGEKELFLQFYETEPIAVPPSLPNNLSLLIDKLGVQEVTTVEKKPAKRLMLWASVAASVAILLIAGVYMSNPSFKGDYSTIANTKNGQDTRFTDAEYAQAENAMRLLSTNFNKGMEQLDEMNTKLEQTNNILNKTFKKLNSHEN